MTTDTPLLRLLYVSRSLVQEEAAEAEMERILATARQRNAGLGLTGALSFGAGCFAQVLEGPATTVQAVFELIRRDPRHDRVVVLEATRVEAREFGEWSMAYAGRSSAAEAQRFAALAAGADAGQEGSRRLAEILRGAARRAEARRAAAVA